MLLTSLWTSVSVLLMATPPDASRIPAIQFEKYVLPNGLQVILHEDHSTPIVGVNVWYHVGSKNEQPGRTGFAHLFEHMMFQGTEHHDGDYFLPLQKAGAKLNGSTSADRTNYWETVPSNYLGLALWMEAERMGFLLPAMTQAKLDNQRDVVKNERRQSYENRPYGLVSETVRAAMYPPEHPYSWPTIGSMADIGAATRDDVADFFRRYYHPGNASLCIAGDFDPAAAKRLVAKYFGSLPAGPKVKRPTPGRPQLTGEKRVRMTDRVGLDRVYFYWHSAALLATDDAELDILGQVLGGGKTSRLYKALVRDQQIAQEVEAAQHSEELGGRFGVVVTARPGHSLTEVEAAAAVEIRRLQDEGPTDEEVTRAVNQFESQFIRALEPVSEFHGRADRLNMYNVYTGDPGYLNRDFLRYMAVDAAGVQRVAKKYLGPNRLVLEVSPGEKTAIEPDPRIDAEKARAQLAEAGRPPQAAAAPVQDTFDRSKMPGPDGQPRFTLPPVRRAQLANGMKLLVVEHHELPVINMHLVCPVGKGQDPADKPGLAAMMAAMWDEGTPERTSEQIAEQLAMIGATLSVVADWDTTSVRLFTLKRQLAPALEILADVLQHPDFPAPELERQRKMALGRLMQLGNEPQALGLVAVNTLLYGPEHPYGRPRFGTPAAIESLAREELADFFQREVRPERCSMIVVGDITLDETRAQLDQALGPWKAASPLAPQPAIPAPPPAKPTNIALVDKPGAAQSVIMVGQLGAMRNAPDYHAVAVMNCVLGGQFSSRLNMNLREDKGYTYGARSTFDWLVHQRGPLVASASVQTAVTAAAVVEFLREIEGMVGGRPVTAEELALAKQYLTLGFPAGFETPVQVASQLEALVTFGLPDDHFNQYPARLRGVSGDDLAGAARRLLKPERLTIVVVGDRGKIESDLRKLPVGKGLQVFHLDPQFRLAPVASE